MDRWVIEQNIARFRLMLSGTLDAPRRHEVERLLAEEEARLVDIDKGGKAP